MARVRAWYITVVAASFGIKKQHRTNCIGNRPSFCSSGYSRIKDILVEWLESEDHHFHSAEFPLALSVFSSLQNHSCPWKTTEHMCIVCMCHVTFILRGLCVYVIIFLNDFRRHA